MTEPAQKCENYAIFKQNYTQKLLISFKISYYCCFGLRGNLEFPDFLQKKFYYINYRSCLIFRACSNFDSYTVNSWLQFLKHSETKMINLFSYKIL